MSWSIHHVNLPATDVRASAEFYTKILGMAEAPGPSRRRSRWATSPPIRSG